MSAINIPGLDLNERSGSHRVRARVFPFYALTATKPSELEAIQWGCEQLGRLHQLHRRLVAEGRLPKLQLTRESAKELGLLALIEPEAAGALAALASSGGSLGSEILVSEVIQTYRDNEGKGLGKDFLSRAKRVQEYFGAMTLAQVTKAVLDEYETKRLSGELGGGRSAGAAYASKNREWQRNKYRRQRGIPVVESSRPGRGLPFSGSVRHELATFRRALKAFALRDDARREALVAYIQLHPVMTRRLPSAGAPRTRRISDDEFKRVLKRISCPKKRSAILLALYTTARRAEVCSFLAEDVKFDEATVLLRHPTIVDPDNPDRLIPKPNTKTRQRDVPLVPEALELMKHLAPPGSSGPIFDFADGSLTQAWGRAAEDAGVTDVRVHDVRREGLSWLHDVYELTLEQLTLFSGHTNTKTLQKHYFQPSAARMAASIAAKSGRREIEI